MATIDECVARVKRRLSRRNDMAIAVEILDEMKAAVERLENGATLPWFLETRADYTTAGALESLAPSVFTGFIRESEKDVMRYYNAAATDPNEAWEEMTKESSLQVMIQKYPGNTDTVNPYPLIYVKMGELFYFRPKPAAGGVQLRLCYFRHDPTAVASGATTLWSTHASDLLIAETGIYVAEYLRDAAALQIFTQMRGAAMAQLIRQNQAHEDAAQEYVMGDD